MAYSPVQPSDGSVGQGSMSSTLAAEVLQMSGLLAQDGSAKEGGWYTFPVMDVGECERNSYFELNREDTLHLIGLLNSSEVDIAQRELSVLLGKLDRTAVEGITWRLFSALSRRTQEIAELENQASSTRRAPAAKKRTEGGRANSTSSSQMQQQRSSQRALSPRATLQPELGDQHAGQQAYVPIMTPRQGGAQELRRPAGHPANMPRSPRDATRPSNLMSPRRSAGKELQQLRQMQQREQLQKLQELELRHQEQQGLQPEASSSVGSPRGDGRMPQVFRRLTAPTNADHTEQVNLLHLGMSRAPVSMGGELQGPHVTAYLDSLIQERGGRGDTSILSQEDGSPRRSPRMSEEKAKEVFDRLYKSGKEARVRRRVYSELGLLVEQAKEAHTCTFEPRLPLAKYPQGFVPQKTINERLYQDSFDRRRRRQEMQETAPVPLFRPHTSMSSMPTLRRDAGGLSPRDTLASEDGLGSEYGMQSGSPNSCHDRLFREHQERKARHEHRQEALAEWRKHTFKPDISTSQATGPMVKRSHSAAGLHYYGNADEAAGCPAYGSSTTSSLAAVAIATNQDGGMMQDEQLEEQVQDGHQQEDDYLDYSQAQMNGQDGSMEDEFMAESILRPSSTSAELDGTMDDSATEGIPRPSVVNPADLASSYKLHLAPGVQGEASCRDWEDDQQPLDEVAEQSLQESLEPDMQVPVSPPYDEAEEPQDLVQPPAPDASLEQGDEGLANNAGSRVEPPDEDWTAAAHLSAVCKELRKEADAHKEQVEAAVADAMNPSPGAALNQHAAQSATATMSTMYLNPQGQAHSSPAHQGQQQVQHQPLRRQWLHPAAQPQPQKSHSLGALVAGHHGSAEAVHASMPNDAVVSRQASAATMHSTSQTPVSSPPMPTRNFSGRLLVPHSRTASGSSVAPAGSSAAPAGSFTVPQTAGSRTMALSPPVPGMLSPRPVGSPHAQISGSPCPGSPSVPARHTASQPNLLANSPGSSVNLAAWPGAASSGNLTQASVHSPPVPPPRSQPQLKLQPFPIPPSSLAAPPGGAVHMHQVPVSAAGPAAGRYPAHPHHAMSQAAPQVPAQFQPQQLHHHPSSQGQAHFAAPQSWQAANLRPLR
eukprot:TRINITY_DN13253_c0_g1_i2.p1 TRINITY_DN13253_c0_g1~~TRINITY_DN13253_c0_g1_i2.p1  ORF type:complete len:1120 (+),score=237.77 TRINITY_DN13253_c0_g1_i2:39-3362(+)